jgi:dUTP pyrophosphatase
MIVKFKKLHWDAATPTQASDGAAGFDLTCTDVSADTENRVYRYYTGIAVEIPAGYVGLIFPRSSVFKTGHVLANSVGVIDSDYRGEIQLVYRPVRNMPCPYERGDRIGQLVILPAPQVTLVEVDELSDTARGEGGFGSTGA